MKNLWTKLNKSDVEKTSSKGIKAYYAVLAAALVLVGTMFTQVSALSNIAETFRNTFSEIYSVLMSVVTIIAVVLVAICLLLRMVSKNPRTAEEATSWIKRIIITWLCLMLLSLFLQYGLSIVDNSGADTVDPWN
jgi:putative copper export protein